MSAQPAHDAFGLPPGVLPRILAVLRAWPQIGTVTLFGSRALGTFRTGSDIDLCLTAPGLGLSELLQIETQIDDLLLPWKVDLLLRHQIDNPDLLDHIDRVGVEL
ncbi:nucleotidyltransferase family protein [Pseudazoarcus pumilus]|uniref:DNA polymerase subunit beta n=1 Tax=Pseudazoarcus pumilus TaxID=2067960 RepID=A0A2I6S3R6_9RHOO|nr:nucleotidyltransferase domain-containing protein [Pseudazoarcus pumilus]AUN93909.1 DNA polymerase subunit beta [Pseudazoarcus pumilus]